MSRSKELTVLAAILLVGFLIRCVYLYDVAQSPHLTHPISDAAYNDYWARGSITGHWPPSPHVDGPLIPQIPYIKAPGYPFVLSIFYRLTGGSYLGVHLIHMLLGLGSCLLLYLLTRQLFNAVAALIATAMMATYWTFIYYENLLHAPVLVVFLSLLVVNLIARWHPTWTWKRALVLGLLFGVFGVIRKNAFVLLAPFFLWLWWTRKRQHAAFDIRRTIALITVGAAITILPSMVRNAIVADSFVPISCDAGRNLYIGNNAWANGVHPLLPEQVTLGVVQGLNLFNYPNIVFALQHANVDTASFPLAEKYFTGKAIRYMWAHPWRTLRMTLKKTVLFWGPDEVSSDQVTHYDRLASRVLKRLPLSFSFVLAVALTGVLIFLAQHRYQRDLEPSSFFVGVLVLLFMLTLFLSFLPGLPESRYRVGLIPFLMMFGGYAVSSVLTRIAKREWSVVVLWVTMGTVTYALVGAQHTQYQPDRAKWHYEQGIVYADAGLLDMAGHHYASAFRVRPDFVEAHNNLGIVLAKMERYEEAEVHLLEAIRLSPRYLQPYNSLIALKLKENKPDEALSYSHRALAIQPGSALTYYNMAYAHTQKGEWERAVEMYEAALERQPSYAEAHNNLGALLARMGQHEEALAHFDEALAISPNYAQAKKNRDRLQAMRTQTPIAP